MTISAKVIADSITTVGNRITSFELEFPRFLLPQFNTHRQLSRNAASSRAIPVKKMIAEIERNPAMPIHWGKNQPGMQADEECVNEVTFSWPTDDRFYDTPWTEGTYPREEAWEEAMERAVYLARAFDKAGYHKQIVNRLLEPYSHIKVVCTATEYDNFFWLRCHEDAQPEIHDLAVKMREARDASEPVLLGGDDWHLPYYKDGYLRYEHHDHWETERDTAKMISASCCAQVSYRTLDESPEKAQKIYEALVASTPVHASPFEHQARPMISHRQKGVTHQTVDGRWWSGNFSGWIQGRQLIEGHCYE